MEIHVRPGRSNELPELIELQSHALKTLCARDYDAEQVAALVSDQANGRKVMDELLFVADVDGQAIGFSALSKIHPLIGAVYVHPDWVRQGVGTKLVAAIEEAAIQRQIRTLRVLSSLTAVPFYRSQNYQSKRSTGFRTQSGVWIPCQLLEKQLPLSASAAQPSSSSNSVLVLLLLGLLLGIGMCHSDRKNEQSNSPTSSYSR
jgi:putative acetyltransferase